MVTQITPGPLVQAGQREQLMTNSASATPTPTNDGDRAIAFRPLPQGKAVAEPKRSPRRQSGLNRLRYSRRKVKSVGHDRKTLVAEHSSNEIGV